jgi:hypothetical protein
MFEGTYRTPKFLTVKLCKYCGETKPLEAFKFQKCHACTAAVKADWHRRCRKGRRRVNAT